MATKKKLADAQNRIAMLEKQVKYACSLCSFSVCFWCHTSVSSTYFRVLVQHPPCTLLIKYSSILFIRPLSLLFYAYTGEASDQRARDGCGDFGTLQKQRSAARGTDKNARTAAATGKRRPAAEVSTEYEVMYCEVFGTFHLSKQQKLSLCAVFLTHTPILHGVLFLQTA